MAYSFSATKANFRLNNRPYVVITITETGVTGATDEWSVQTHSLGTLHVHKCTLTAGDGSATTIDPTVSEKTGTASVDSVFSNGSAAASARNTPIGAHYYTPTGILYGRSGANGTTGTTGSIVTVLYIEAGLST